MRQKPKSWLWVFTYPFAHNTYTTINQTIYFPKGHPPTDKVIRHEQIHMRQQQEIGFWKFAFLYVFYWPIFKNEWRKKWEVEAYVMGTGISEEKALQILENKTYGWIK